MARFLTKFRCNPLILRCHLKRAGYDTYAHAEIELINQEEWARLAADHADDPRNNEVKRYDRFIHFNERPPRKDKDGKEVARKPYDLEGLINEWVQPGGKKHIIEAGEWETREGQKQFLTAIKKFTTS